MSRSRTTPRPKAMDPWEQQVVGGLAFVEAASAAPSIHGDKWRQGMCKYYAKRVLALLDQPPKGKSVAAMRYQRRLKTALRRAGVVV